MASALPKSAAASAHCATALPGRRDCDSLQQRPAGTPGGGRDAVADEKRDPFEGVEWSDGAELGVEGRGFDDVAQPYDRLPTRAEGVVRAEVWRRSRQPAGLSVRFRTDATEIFARWRLGEVPFVPPHRTAVAMAGLDCYGRDERDGGWYWVGTTNPWRHPEPDGRFNAAPLDGAFREYRAYLPIGCPVESLLIGVRNARFETCEPDPRPPVVVYGTSICQGTCVSRAGMTHVAILERRLLYPFVNLGFGGNGRMEPEVTDLIAEIDATVFLIDCLPNMEPSQVRTNMPRLVEILRGRRPDVPILFVGNRLCGDGRFIPERARTQAANSAAQREVFDMLVAEGASGLHILDAADFFGEDQDGTVDGSHPSDLGSIRMADAVEPALRRLLPRSRQAMGS
jgi:hypothetical protein